MKNNLELACLRVFARVAELESFTAAAEQLGLPKGRVSQRVQQLEAQLGVRLFHRSTRKVQLSPDGDALLARAQALLADADDMAALFQREPAQLRGHLRLDCPVRIGLDFVLPALPAFLAAHPQLSLDLSSTDRRVNPVDEGFDCVLRVGATHDPLLVARPLGLMPQINAAAPAYLARVGTPRKLADLQTQGHQLVHYAQRLNERDAAFEYLDAGALKRLPLPAAVAVNQTEAYEAAAIAGLGLIQLPLLGARAALADGRLQRLLPRYEAPPLPVQLLWPQQRSLSRRTRALVEWLDALLRPQLQPWPQPKVASSQRNTRSPSS